MKKSNVLIISVMILIVGFMTSCAYEKHYIHITNITMKLTSPAFGHNENIPKKYTCDSENISPPLIFSDVPTSAKSLVLIVDDPDAPAGDWVHWTVWNIRPDLSEIAEAKAPQGATEGYTDFGKTGWGGPCPPSGTHRYRFNLYALDRVLDLPETARKSDLEKAMEGHVLDSTVLIGLYQRKQS